jgi:hypothetical protein
MYLDGGSIINKKRAQGRALDLVIHKQLDWFKVYKIIKTIMFSSIYRIKREHERKKVVKNNLIFWLVYTTNI